MYTSISIFTSIYVNQYTHTLIHSCVYRYIYVCIYYTRTWMYSRTPYAPAESKPQTQTSAYQQVAPRAYAHSVRAHATPPSTPAAAFVRQPLRFPDSRLQVATPRTRAQCWTLLSRMLLTSLTTGSHALLTSSNPLPAPDQYI